MSEIKASKKQVKAAMKILNCEGPVVSEGLAKGKKFCLTHGSANDVGHGWGKRGCEEAGKIADAVVRASKFEYAWLTREGVPTASRFPTKKKAVRWGNGIFGLTLVRHIKDKWERVD